MKTLGKIVTWVAGVIVVVCVALTTIASCQGKTIKDMIPEQKVEQEIVDDENQDVTDETLDPEVDSGTTASINYNAQSNTICL